ncbi:odorant receptor 13a-like [Bicyclus anynana]|uniref:Odorant receptor n=1 Tax=Bicyclus anynana TaxID=110368 RepID=A0A6J1NHT3_BICAN|nr:odorant receptor 13a-like [Bicyclus anynana]
MVLFLTDGRDLIGVTEVQDIKYMQLLRFAMRILNAWPESILDKNISKYAFYGKCYTFFIEFICLPPGFLYIKNSIGTISFLDLGRTYITVFMNIVAMLRLILIFLKRYEKLVGDFVNKIHLFHHRNKSVHAMKIHILVHKLSHFFSVYTAVMMILGILLFTCTPLYKNITSGAFFNYQTENVTFEHSVYYDLPFDYEHDIRGYIVLFSFNWYITLICSACFCTFDLLMALMVFHVWGHLSILVKSLENFRRPNENGGWFNEIEMKLVSSELKEIVEHHNLVIEFTTRMGNIFGPVLILYYIFHVVSGCVLLLECSQMNPEALVRYGTLTFLVFQQLLQISIVFELLGSKSYSLINAVYTVPWECMDNSNRKMVQIMLLQSQRLLAIKALDMVNVGVQTMASIIKTSISYFIMLRTFAEMD